MAARVLPGRRGPKGRRERGSISREFLARVRFRGRMECNAMRTRDLQRNPGGSAPLTSAAGPQRSRARGAPRAVPCSSIAEAGLDRLLAMMARWWDGWTVARIARECGITRQRAAALLAEVGCTRIRWCRADHDRADSRRRAMPAAVREARASLLHPLAHHLTIRQRAALAWRAMGLASPDIARRMLTTPQNVRHFQIAAWRRLKRLERARHEEVRKRWRARYANGPRSGNSDDARIEWRELFPDLDGSSRNAGSATEESA